MMDFSFDNAGVRVGLEIHQQLNTGRKLFCNCSGVAPPGIIQQFTRRLRPVKSEMGRYDPAAVFEGNRDMSILYHADDNNSCLVERDEEPPHHVDNMSKEISLVVSAALKSTIYEEIYAMRKTVIDGSNTSGFQRTMLVSRGGILNVGDISVGVQSICLEEDSARVLGEKDGVKEYNLDRLGIPLIEIALEPISGTPHQVRLAAEGLGRLLRGIKMVARGIGTIRQDVNISVRDGNGIVEIKGLQQLDQLERVVEYEARRQSGLVHISQILKKKNIKKITTDDIFDITGMAKKYQSKIIQKAIKQNNIISCIRLRNFAGILGYEPYNGIRLGQEIGQLVKYYGVGGIFHTDELPNYGIVDDDVKLLYKHMGMTKQDAFIMVACPAKKTAHVLDSISKRIYAATKGVPSETRLAIPQGGTVFLRPRPGSSRMYPETDIPPIIISKNDIIAAQENIPESWERIISKTASKYRLNTQLAEQLLDSDYVDVFADVIKETDVSPPFVASILCSTITELSREGLNSKLLNNNIILETFRLLQSSTIPKESVPIIFRDIMSGNSSDVNMAIKNTNTTSLSDTEIINILQDIIRKNNPLIQNQGERAARPLMGMAMSKLRGKASGQKINHMLNKMLHDIINDK
ncbi:MAG: Glu-tRNA(Gln) amidotransferase subunit GatE [Cenarchaeum sp. SB0661_bin_35]|nr:Glu-tRNA(Gln) amidotransferase subunit GatE [Cenarchaeum sp. SB0666_bin_15]MYB47060.1 Glu-tRNA(Gln) amidotransferase subunit GatE [Cenarchaeum sp. SB0662_bin_33]MYC79827.1 Glu-tRNA(Gln) amidotransferase subunit GatE [Cenarchaeum sp. SB0661_bin_35]MYD59202.1 Glu-tRNA(Gln) amidotransferase subunit GatE [Cenarchaeum sp. SB0678_bin_8]MYG32525.1 Glu-tRNA(Gln) amidotransferase subunit GatE [Cenarchaeum sp. SB0677_bin_16]